jgi:glycosyltransferase involved in cell wall biosynthesis
MRRLKVLHVVPHMHIGGLEKVIVNLWGHLDRHTIEMSVCCQLEKGVLGESLQQAGCEVLQLPVSRRKTDYFTWVKLCRLLRARRFDIVHSHSVHAFIDCALCTLLAGVPRWVHTFHFGNYPHLPKHYLAAQKYLGPLARQLVAVGYAQRDSLVRHLCYSPRMLEVIWNGVELEDHGYDDSRRRALREELGIVDGMTVIGSVAVLTEQKGIPVLFDAARSMLQARSDLRFVVVGGGPLEDSLRRRCREMGLADRVVFTGWREEASEMLKLFDIFVMPSLWEAMPIVLLEAMAAARPVVATTVGDIPRIIEDGETGLLAPAGDPEALADRLLRLAGDSDLRHRLGDAGNRSYKERFTAQPMAVAYEHLYQRLMA